MCHLTVPVSFRSFGENDMKLDVYSFTSQGGRGNNEDSVGFRTEDDYGLFVVADGLGGHAKGEVASDCVIKVLLDNWSPVLQNNEPSRAQWLSEKFFEANQAILNIQKAESGDMKSTGVALAIDGDKACWAHVGDSRLYYITKESRHGTSQIMHITEDHSVAFKKYLAGMITRWEINSDDDQSSLLRTLGSADRFEITPGPEDIQLTSDDAFLLCSDGVWEYLHDMDILVDFLKSQNAGEWGYRLLSRVMDRVDGSNDNLSLITVIIG